MSATEQIWFIVGIAGFLFILEGAFSYVIKTIVKDRINENILKVAFGLFIFIFALVMLFTLPNDWMFIGW